MKPAVQMAHHWLVGMRGGEKVLEQLALLFPGSHCHTLVAAPERLSPVLRSLQIRTSILQRLPCKIGPRHYKALLPFFPAAIRRLRVESPVDFLFSSDAAVIKGLAIPDGLPHVCYCHSPPRYLWDMQETYLQKTSGLGWLGRQVFSATIPRVREFDREASRSVTAFIANSAFVQERIRTCYGRESQVIHPPVFVDEFQVRSGSPDDFYLIVSQLVPYKRIDLAVQAFNRLGKKLVIIGEGSEMRQLQALAKPNITFLGALPHGDLREHYRRCRAFIFPGIEDFGITPLEAQASGAPVIAYRAGGALETVLEGETGIFFESQDADSLAEAIEYFERDSDHFDPARCRRQAERFSAGRFRSEIKSYLERFRPDFFKNYNWPI